MAVSISGNTLPKGLVAGNISANYALPKGLEAGSISGNTLPKGSVAGSISENYALPKGSVAGSISENSMPCLRVWLQGVYQGTLCLA